MSYDFALRYCHPFVLGISHTIFWILSPVWSSPKQRGQLKSNFIEMFIRWSSTNFIFFSFDQKSSLVATTEPRGPSVLNRAFSGMYFSTNFDKKKNSLCSYKILIWSRPTDSVWLLSFARYRWVKRGPIPVLENFEFYVRF
jgi:hypothetical protein